MSYQLMFQKALELQQNGALNEAEQIYRQILETAPNNADVLNLLGLIAQTRGLHNEAINYFYRAADFAPRHFPIYFNLAVSLGALNKYLEATEAYQKVLQLKPDCKEAHLGLGNLYWAQNRLEEAKSEFSAALKTDAQYMEACTNLAEISDDTATLQNIAADNPQALYYLGRRAFNENNFSSAADFLQQADKLISDAEIKSLLGETLLKLKQPDAALILFYQAYKLNPYNVSALLNIADISADSHNFAESEKFYKKSIAVDQQNLRAHTNYANLLCNNKRLLEALEEYRAAILIAPEAPELSYNLALILKNLEEYEQALDLMFHAYYMAPEHTDWCLNIAETLILFYQNAPDKSLKICENWLQKMPDNLIAKHLWGAFNHQPITDEKEYTRILFDTFAANYEDTLNKIHYNVVNKIAELFAPLDGNILDLGCGTGLIGQKLNSDKNTFTGVDISAKMLDIARTKNIYKKLINDDIIHFLSLHNCGFATIIAADVFCYFGSLQPLISNCLPARLIFSLETDLQTEEYILQPNGRYKHNPQYVHQLLLTAGYTKIKTHSFSLRQENGQDVPGIIFSAE